MAYTAGAMSADPIVIVGMGCRLPGDITSPSELWDFLAAQKSAQSDVPANRFDIDKWYHPDPKRKGGIASRGGYFLSHGNSYRNFDPSFFGIHPLEAASMDPQQRKLLEVVYETFESAGTSLDQASGSQTACYVGAFTHDFNRMLSRDTEEYFPYSHTGSDMTILSNRVSYVFNLKGPSFTVDTACSSSLYALHLACQGLQLGDYDAAIVGGTNMILDVQHQLLATKLGILSPTSTCHTFDESADGFGRADGITVLYIKRLSDAIANKDPIRGVIRSTAVNTNGRGYGITHPGRLGQEAVIRRAYSGANLPFHQTGYVECHGTGTPVGDPIEVAAIGDVFAQSRTPQTPLLLSALKSNIGHTEGASGIASVQKVVLSLEKGVVPATIGIIRLNPAIDMRGGRLKIACGAEAWPDHLQYRRASVNSFGYGGANAHIIIDAAQSYFYTIGHLLPQTWTSLAPGIVRNQYLANGVAPKGLVVEQAHYTVVSNSSPILINGVHKSKDLDGSSKNTSKLLLVSSAHDMAALKKNVDVLSEAVSTCDAVDLAYTLAIRRTLFRSRAITIISESVSRTDVVRENWKFGFRREASPTLAFAFTGQGAQWARMGIDLVDAFPVVRRTFETLQAAMDTVMDPPDWTLLSALMEPPDRSRMMIDVTVTVTLCTAIQIAIIDLLDSWGIRPRAVVGHSSGEAAAAYSTGLITASEAIITSYYRALAIMKRRVPGAMMAVGLGAAEVQSYIDGHADLFLACHNSPESVTVSGKPDAIDKFGQRLGVAGIFARKVMSSGNANHSPMVSPAAEYFINSFKDSLPNASIMAARVAKAPMYSCITTGVVYGKDVGVQYWGQNISDPVLFNQAAQNLLTSEPSVDHIIEIGPHSALAGPIRQIKAALGYNNERLAFLPSLIRGGSGVDDMLRLVGALYLTGYPVDIAQVNAKEGTTPRLLVDLPTYQWNYDQIHWTEGRVTREQLFRKHNRHDLLGSREPGSNSAPLWRNKLQVKDVPWIADHKIGNEVLFPASGYIAMALEAVAQMAMDAGTTPTKFSIQDVSIVSPIVFSSDDVVETLLNLWYADDTSTQGQNRSFKFRISSVHATDKWSEHALGTITFDDDIETYSDVQEITSIIPARAVAREKRQQDWYATFRDVGLHYGPTFRTLTDIRCISQNKAQAYIALHPTKNNMQHESSYFVHPATLDGCLQLSFIAAQHEKSIVMPRAYLPYQVKSMTIWNHQTLVDDFALIEGHGEACGFRSVESSINLATTDGLLLVQADVTFLSVEGGLLAIKEETDPQPYQRLEWAPDVDHLTGSMSCSTFNSIAGQTKVDDGVKQRTSLMRLRDIFGGNGENYNRLSRNFEKNSSGQDESPLMSLNSLRKLVELISFKQPGLRILEIGTNFSLISAAILAGAGGGSVYPAYSSFTFTNIETEAPEASRDWLNTYKNTTSTHVDLSRDLSKQGFEDHTVDLLVLLYHPDGRYPLRSVLQRLRPLLSPLGRLIIVKEKLDLGAEVADGQSEKSTIHSPLEKVEEETLHEGLIGAGYSGIQLEIGNGEVLLSQLAIRDPQTKPSSWVRASGGLWFVYRDEHPLIEILEKEAIRRDYEVHRAHILEIDSLPKGGRVVMLVELDQPLLSSISTEELKSLRTLFEQASSIVWVTSDQNPELTLIQGMTQVIMVEHPHLQLSTLNLEAGGDLTYAANLILQHEMKPRTAGPAEDQIALRDSIACISRYVLDEEANMDDLSQIRPVIVNGQYEPGLCLDMLHVGKVASYFFRSASGLQTAYHADHADGGSVAVSPRLYGLSQQEALALKGQTFDSHFSHECLGIVTRVGHNSKFAPGDHVVCLKPAKFDSELLVREELCVACADVVQDGHIVGLLVPMCIAVHALLNVARVRKGEVMVVNAPGSLLNIAICEVGQQIGLDVLVVYSSNDEKKYLQQHYKTKENSLIATSTTDLQHTLAATTFGRIDVVISSFNGSLTSRLWSCLAPKGRLVITDANPDLRGLDPTVFSRGVSISSFSLTDTLKNNLDEAAELLRKSLEYSRGAATRLLPPQQFQLNELETAVQSILSNDARTRVSLVCGPDVTVHVSRAQKSPLVFRSDSSYLLVGCLGGLGRSLTMWMRERGAREFIFLSRSADEKPEAAALVQDLRADDITVTVVRGDVTVHKDVEHAILAANHPVRGIIQAAVVYKDSNFSAMTLDTFNAVVQPKVRGTINLHKASLKLDLDFFVMTSSTIGVVGASGQSHYAAANAFLDSMASHRRSLGLRATSLSLGMVVGVGHVHENPEIESIQRKRGIYGITEAEYLRMMERACMGEDQAIDSSQRIARSLIVTGLDPTKLAASMRTSTPEWASRNARLSHIRHAIVLLSKPTLSNQDNSSSMDLTSNTQLFRLISTGAEETALRAAVKSMILHKLSALVLIPVEKLVPSLSRPLAEIGLDSIIGAEFRAWAWHELKVELSFLQLLENGRSLEWLVETVWKGVNWAELQ